MQPSCTAHSVRPPIWTYLSIGCFTFGVMMGLLFLITTDTLLISIFRLAAFAGIAGAIISYLNTRQPELRMELFKKGPLLRVDYYDGSKKVQEEEFEAKTIKSITVQQPAAVWGLFAQPNLRLITLSFSDSDTILSVFRFQDQNLFVPPADAQAVCSFIKSNAQAQVLQQ